MAEGPLHEALATVRQTNAAHVSALDALERAFTAETALPLPRLDYKAQTTRTVIFCGYNVVFEGALCTTVP